MTNHDDPPASIPRDEFTGEQLRAAYHADATQQPNPTPAPTPPPNETPEQRRQREQQEQQRG